VTVVEFVLVSLSIQFFSSFSSRKHFRESPILFPDLNSFWTKSSEEIASSSVLGVI